MAAADAAVGQDGSIILCTCSGTVWKKEKRANIKLVHSDGVNTSAKSKDYKFVRVPNIFGAIAVRSNAFGAFYAVRKDCSVMKDQIAIEPPKLWSVLFKLLPFEDYKYVPEDEGEKELELRFWKPTTKGPSTALIKSSILSNPNAEKDFTQLSKRYEPLSASDFDVWITSNVTDVRIPVHSLVMKARSRILRTALSTFSETYYFSVPDVLSIEYGPDGQICMHLNGADFLTIVNIVLYMYTDQVLDVWRYTSRLVSLAPRYRQVRTEIMRIANALEMKQLEKAVRIMDEPAASLRDDFEVAFHDSNLFSDADTVINLADGEERYAHSVILRSRCPFFEGFFQGHTGGMWMAHRRQETEEGQAIVHIDLSHIDSNVFELVLRHIYADTSEELFDFVVTKDLDEFLDLVIEVMAVANELMLERLARVCQKAIGRYITPRNVCGLLNTIAESSEVDFKQAALEYIGLDLENMLEQGLLEELDGYLLEELDETVQENQRAFMPFARSDRALEVLLEQNWDLVAGIEICRQRRLDSMRLPSRYVVEPVRPPTRVKSDGTEAGDIQIHSSAAKSRAKSDEQSSPAASPAILPQDTREDLPFEMDDDRTGRTVAGSYTGIPPLAISDKQGMPITLNRMSSSRSSGMISEHDDSDHDSASVSTTPLTPKAINLSLNPFETSASSKAAWAKSTTKMPTLGLRDIMQQDSTVKVSNLTQSLKQAASSSGSAAVKMSQRERKRQQHQLKTEVGNTEPVDLSKSVDNNLSANTPSTTKAPWQKVTAPVPSPFPPPSRTKSELSESLGNPRRSPLTPKSDTAKASMSVKQDKTQDASKTSRSTSTPGMTGTSRIPPPQIQSIRHTPNPVRSSSWLDARTPMADILAQQQYEKIAVKETAAKRSLHDIQQEQEFQEWWDNESRRVQEEEAVANLAATRKSRGGGRGRGGNRRKASERGEQAIADRSEAPETEGTEEKTPLERAHRQGTDDSKAERGKSRSRGGGRGRGRSVSNT